MADHPEEFIPTRQTLLSRLKNWEDQESWQEFFKIYRRLIFSTALKSGLSEVESEEAVQETLISVAKTIKDFKYDRARCTFKSWLGHLTRKRIADQFRKRARHQDHLHLEAPQSDTPQTPAIERIPDPNSPSVEAIWEEQWQAKLMTAALDRVKKDVSPGQFQIFDLYAVRKMPAGEVAAALGTSAGQVYLTKHRVAALLKKEVKRLEAQMNKGLIVAEQGQGPPPAELDYEALRLIGRGGYGEVWLVRDKTGRYLACKVIYRASFDHDRPYEREYGGIQRFEGVSRANDAQVNILYVGRRDATGYFYYIMELGDDVVTGQQISPDTYVPKTLYSEIKRRGHIPTGESLRIALSLSAALENLHEHGLIHRDVKPGNIIFVNGIPKLADIGLVTDRHSEVSYVGTEGYIPPEGPGSVQADIYGLGIVLYEMTTGKDRLDFPELPPNLREGTSPDALLELNQVALKACAANPRQRYQTAAEMHADLTWLSSGKSLRQKKVQLARLKTISVFVIVALVAVAASVGIGLLVKRKNQSPAGISQPAVATVPVPQSDVLAEGPTNIAPEENSPLARVCLREGFDAYGQNDYDRAKSLGARGLAAAQNDKNQHSTGEAEFLNREIARCQERYDKIAPFIQTLKQNPNDGPANLAAGEFLCFVKNDWDAGLAQLALGNDEAIRAVAVQDLRKGDESSLGDAWWNLARNASGDVQAGCRQRSRYWYLKAIAKGNESNRAAMRQRLQDRIRQDSFPYGEAHIMSRVGNAQHIDLYADEVRWKSEGNSMNDRINQVLLGDLKGKAGKIVKNSEATWLYPAGVDFSTAQMKIDHKGKKRGNAKLEIFDDHIRVTLIDRPSGASEVDITVTFGARP